MKNTTEHEVLSSSDHEDNKLTSLIPKDKIPWTDSILVKTVSFGTNVFFLGTYMAGSSKLIASLGESGAGAQAVIGPFQAAILGGSVGFILSMGLEMANSVAIKDYKKAGQIIKTGWIFTVGTGAIGSAVMLSTRGIFPLIFSSDTANTAASFFSGCSIGNIPLLLLIADAQVAFHAGEWYIPPTIGVLLFGTSVLSSYYLAFAGEMGAFGVGLGNSLGPLAIAIGMRLWFLKSSYAKYELYQLSKIPEFKKILANLFHAGWKLSAQRLTEWANLLLITVMLGRENNLYLIAAGPLIQYISLLAACTQGVAASTGMMIKRNNAARDKALTTSNTLNELTIWRKKNISTLIQSNLAVIIPSALVSPILYFTKEPAVNFFLSGDVSSETKELAETLLWVGFLGSILDAIRIVTGGALRGWSDILYPTIISVLTMIIINIPLGYGLEKAFDDGDNDAGSDAAWVFHARNITIFLAAIMMVYRCKKLISNDSEKLRRNCNEIQEETETNEENPVIPQQTISRHKSKGIFCCFFRSPDSDVRQDESVIVSHRSVSNYSLLEIN